MSTAKTNRDRKNMERVYAFVESLTRIGAAEIIDLLQVQEEAAREVMMAIARAVVVEHARTEIYVPAAVAWEYADRVEQIWAEYQVPGPDGALPFTLDRVRQLAQKYGKTERQIYKIVQHCREADARARQPKLPGLEVPL